MQKLISCNTTVFSERELTRSLVSSTHAFASEFTFATCRSSVCL